MRRVRRMRRAEPAQRCAAAAPLTRSRCCAPFATMRLLFVTAASIATRFFFLKMRDAQ